MQEGSLLNHQVMEPPEHSPLCDDCSHSTTTFSHGLASHDAAGKGEDTHASHSDGELSGFGIFDGHSGKLAAQACAASLLPSLLSSGFPDKPAVSHSFWEVDESLAWQGVSDGSTATVLLCESAHEGEECVRAMLAWVGDSKAVRVDLTKTYPLTSVRAATRNHSPRCTEELDSLKTMALVRSRVEAGATLEDALAEHAAPLAGVVEADAKLRLMRRVLERSRRSSELCSSGSESRRNAHIIRRSQPEEKRRATQAARKQPPWVVSTETEFSHPHYRDLQMTRSIGDWLAADLVVPQPDIMTFTVGPHDFERVVLASDGLWDVVSTADVATVCRRSANPQLAADRLLRMAKEAYQRRGVSGFRDDTTILVVDINPSNLPMREAPVTCDEVLGVDCACCTACCSLGDVLSPLLRVLGLEEKAGTKRAPVPLLPTTTQELMIAQESTSRLADT